MSGYFYTLILTSVCGSACALLASGGFEKYIKYIAALVCTVLMISPFKDINTAEITQGFTEMSESFDASDGLYPMATQMTEDRAEEYISQIVFSEFGIYPLYTNIKIDWDQTEPIIEKITVALEREHINNSEGIKKYLREILGGEVEIIEG